MAAERANPKQIQQLEILVEEMTHLMEAGNFENYGRKNAAFHFLIGEASQNSFITLLLSTVRRYMEEWSLVKEIPLLMDRSLTSHRKILRAIKKGEPISARKAMQKHINEFKKRLENYYSLETCSEVISGSSNRKTDKKQTDE